MGLRFKWKVLCFRTEPSRYKRNRKKNSSPSWGWINNSSVILTFKSFRTLIYVQANDVELCLEHVILSYSEKMATITIGRRIIGQYFCSTRHNNIRFAYVFTSYTKVKWKFQEFHSAGAAFWWWQLRWNWSQQSPMKWNEVMDDEFDDGHWMKTGQLLQLNYYSGDSIGRMDFVDTTASIAVPELPSTI